MNIYLIGYRCTGKTTLGRALAQDMGWNFVDMDDQLVAEQGISIAELVDQKGWSRFRQLEAGILIRIIRKQGLVVGTGGGIILEAANVEAMRSSGKVVWLRSRPETIRRIIATDQRTRQMRPALTDQGLLAEIETTLTEREPLYWAAADVEVATDEFDVVRLCGEIKSKLSL